MSILIATDMISAVNDEYTMDAGEEDSRTELYSHANMAAVGRQALIISDIGRKWEVSPFTPDYEALKQLPIFYATISYTCTYNYNLYIIIFKDEMSLTSTKNNIIPLFIMRETGVYVNTTPKIHTIGEPSE